MAEQEPKKHHYLPAFFLGAWCQPDGRLFRYVKKRGKAHCRQFHPDAVGYRLDLYKLHSQFIEDKQLLEKHHFEKIDKDAAPAIARMIRDVRPPTSEREREAVAKFVLALPARNPWGIALARNLGRDVLASVNNPYQSTDVSLLQALETSEEEVKIARMMEMHWQVCDVSRATPDIVLGDRPFLLAGNMMDNSADVSIALPIGPTRLLFASTQLRAPRPDVVQRVNRHSTLTAVEHIFAANNRHLELANESLRERLDGEADYLLYRRPSLRPSD